MKLFHGSTEIIKKPVIMPIQRLLDFGKGFYTTTNQSQAERWADLKNRRIGENGEAIISVYEINDGLFDDEIFQIKIFKQANPEWLDFVIGNRKGEITHNYDMVKGPVANDSLYATISLFESGLLSKEETIVRLKVHNLFDQVSFHSEKALNELKFVNSYRKSVVI